jgi:pyridoxal phosphate enzyme (YggS family)
MSEERIAQTVRGILDALPPGVTLVAAAKGRTVEQVRAAIRAGVAQVGHNYVQDAEAMIPLVPEPVRWHMIGHLQTNKVKKAVELFDMIETVDSWRLAQEIDKRCAAMGKVMPVLVEVNSGREANKTGVLPEEVDELVGQFGKLPYIRVQGLMTMGPRFGEPEDSRPYFRTTRAAFERLARRPMAHVEMRYLSMGMSNSYRVAIEEGANVVRIGTLLFGEG